MTTDLGTVLVLPGDGIGPEVMAQALRVLDALAKAGKLTYAAKHGVIGGAAIDAHGVPLAEATLEAAKAADAVLLGAVGGPKWDSLDFAIRPEKGLLAIRAGMGLFANLRPAMVFPALAEASSLKHDLVAGLDIMIVRELTGGIYFGQPRGIEATADGTRRGFNTLTYDETEIARIARVAFDLARARSGRVVSVDKANVLEATVLWREVVSAIGAKDYADVDLSHMYVDNAAMQLVRAPKQFDVVVTTNMFGDILSDCAAMLTGSLGMLPSASLGAARAGGGRRPSLYEPVHGSAPDIAGQDKANPLAMILSLGMMLRYSYSLGALADAVEGAVADTLAAGHFSADLGGTLGTAAMGDAVLAALAKRLD